MAYVIFKESGEIEHIRNYHTIGRSLRTVDTRIANPLISKLHAVIEWKDPVWAIRDISQNGVWLNNAKISPHDACPLRIGDRVELAGSDGVGFEFHNADPPRNIIYNLSSKQEFRLLESELLLPSESDPEVMFYLCPDRRQFFSEWINSGADMRQKLVSTQYETGPYHHLDELKCTHSTWCVFMVRDNVVTTEFSKNKPDFDNVHFCFELSRNEESTTLKLKTNGTEINLGERTHHYFLVHLLRHKIIQKAANMNTTGELGWTSTQLLSRELGVEETHINIMIFRARKQINQALADHTGNSKMIQRRRGSVRIGVDNYSIYKDGIPEI